MDVNTENSLDGLRPSGKLLSIRYRTHADSMLAVAKAYVIDSHDMAIFCADDLGKVKMLLTDLNEDRLNITRPLDAAKKGILALFKEPTEYLEEAKNILESALKDWNKQVIEEQRRAEEAARKAAEEAARKYAEEVLEAERKMQAELSVAEEAAKAVAQAEAEAEEAACRGDAEEVYRKIAEAEAAQTKVAEAELSLRNSIEQVTAKSVEAAIAAAPIMPIYEKLKGTTFVDNWKARVTDKMALIKAVAEGSVPEIALTVNETFINQQAKSLKQHLCIPGIEIYNDGSVRSKRFS